MSFHIFNGAFGNRVSDVTIEKYGVEDSELFDMVTDQVYQSLNNPKILGPASMTKSLIKEKRKEEKSTENQKRLDAWTVQYNRIRYNEPAWNSCGNGDEELADELATVLCR